MHQKTGIFLILLYLNIAIDIHNNTINMKTPYDFCNVLRIVGTYCIKQAFYARKI